MEPVWFTIAQTQLGIKEALGYKNNPEVQKYYEEAGAGKLPDSVPWCAAFVGAMLHRAGFKGTGLLAARSYLLWGKKLDKPTHGCIVVFARGTSAWQGHVAFFVRTNANRSIRVLGGNQSDAVTYANYSTNRLLGYRWPVGAPLIRTKKNG